MRCFCKTSILSIIFFVFFILCNFGENTLKDINNALTLENFKVLESEYNEGAFTDFYKYEDLFSPYNKGNLSKITDIERSMYTF